MKDSILSRGTKNELIRIDDENKTITYTVSGKKRKWNNPEEKIQAAAYCALILDYGYPQEQVSIYENVQIGTSNREADIVVYSDIEKSSPIIVVECKKANISNGEFETATNQAFSYAVAIGAKYVWITSGAKDQYHEVEEGKPKGRKEVPDIPRFGQSALAKYKYVYDAPNAQAIKGQKFSDLRKVTQHELTQKFKQAHDALWAGGELEPTTAFDEFNKLIFCKLWDERKLRKTGEPYDFQITKETDDERTAKTLSKRIHDLYEEGRKQDDEVFKDGIRLTPERILSVVRYLQDVDLGATDLDSKGRAFETFMDSFFKGAFGQFFTPRPIVQFIVDTVPINNTQRILDTSCGSGGFLLHALDKVRHQADVAYPEHESNSQQARRHYTHWHTFAEKNLFGIEVNEQIARVAKMNMILHDDGHTNVVTADGLISAEALREKINNQRFQDGGFDIIITNPPFGSTIGQVSHAYFNTYKFSHKEINWLQPDSKRIQRPNQDTEVLFIELCHKYLRDGGYLAIVVPDGILTNISQQYVRDGIEEMFRIIAVVSMPQTAFTHTGAGVKSSVLFLKKLSGVESDKFTAAKSKIQEKLLREKKYIGQLENWQAESEKKLENLAGFPKAGDFAKLQGQVRREKLKAIKKIPEYRAWSKGVRDECRENIDTLQKEMKAAYAKAQKEKMANYPIFMALAENIGYDATGRETNKNDLEEIGKELATFITKIEAGQDDFFV